MNKSFLDLGVNSVLAVGLVEELNRRLGIEMGIEVVFDYISIEQLTNHILSQYKDINITVLKEDGEQSGMGCVSAAIMNDAYQANSIMKSFQNSQKITVPEAVKIAEKYGPEQREPIAVIGMSGRFAQSGNVNELWKHLSDIWE